MSHGSSFICIIIWHTANLNAELIGPMGCSCKFSGLVQLICGSISTTYYLTLFIIHVLTFSKTPSRTWLVLTYCDKHALIHLFSCFIKRTVSATQ